MVAASESCRPFASGMAKALPMVGSLGGDGSGGVDA